MKLKISSTVVGHWITAGSQMVVSLISLWSRLPRGSQDEIELSGRIAFLRSMIAVIANSADRSVAEDMEFGASDSESDIACIQDNVEEGLPTLAALAESFSRMRDTSLQEAFEGIEEQLDLDTLFEE